MYFRTHRVCSRALFRTHKLSAMFLRCFALFPGIFSPFRSRFAQLSALLLRFLLVSTLLLCTTSTINADVTLPDLGDTSGGLISPKEEYEFGQKALRVFRSAMPLHEDPFMEVYIERLLRNLVNYSDLKDKRINLLILDAKEINAFAAPGGIVGVNTGTFLVAESERHLVSILAHELAHLSQRHSARKLQEQKAAGVKSIVAVLASVLIAAASDGDAGIAAIMAAQAGLIDQQLRFSRQMEREADRVGMETLVRAGYDPHSMHEMFELMIRNNRFRTRPPEFLLTHPITESRVSDAKSRSQKFSKRQTPEVKDYQLIRARSILNHESNPQFAIKRFSAELSGNTLPTYAARYGLVLAYLSNNQPKEAQKHIALLESAIGQTDHIVVAKARIAAGKKDYPNAVKLLTQGLKTEPNNHVLNVRLAEILMEATRYQECLEVLLAHVNRRPENAYVWYLLAEVNGLVGNILEVHKSRAEYFILHGIYDKAEVQLRNAARMLKDDFHERAIIEQRLEDVKALQREMRS